MASSLAQNAIALLIDLAERGELDPWDVQVIDVIDRFLSQLQPTRSTEPGRSPYEADLSQSGQAFLYASMLVLLKADTLVRAEVDAHDQVPETDIDLFAQNLRVLPLDLERQLRRRAVAQPIQNRRVTLRELITQIEVIESAVTEVPRRSRLRRPRPQTRSQALRVISQLAHQENLTETATALEQFLDSNWLTLSQGQEWIDFDRLVVGWSCPSVYGIPEFEKPVSGHHAPELSEEPGEANISDRVGLFWALLLLTSQSKVELLQAEFYQDLKIRLISAELELQESGFEKEVFAASLE